MWEIIAEPGEYGIQVLEEGIGENQVAFEKQDRERWAEEIGSFAAKLGGLVEKAKSLQTVLIGEDQILATPASLKTLKVALFKINDAVSQALTMADIIESQIIKK